MNTRFSSPPSHRFVKKPLALLFATLLMTASPHVVADDQAAAAAFYDNPNYTYCDIKLLSAYWGQSRYESKIRAGEKLLRNEVDVVEDYLTSARNYAVEHNVRCSFADADNPPYTYQDAEKLADFWGQSNPAGAKTKVAAMLETGDNKLVQQILRRIEQEEGHGGATGTNPDQAALDAFFNNPNYTYCDVQLLTAYWKQSIYEVKVRAGSKLLANAYSLMEDYRRDARNYALEHNVRCSFSDASNPAYTYDDAVKLAAYWGQANAADAKAKIGRMLQAGDNKLIIQALKNAGNG